MEQAIEQKPRGKQARLANIMITIGLLCLIIPAVLWLNATYYQWSESKKWEKITTSSDVPPVAAGKGSNNSIADTGSGEDTSNSAELVDRGPVAQGADVAFLVIPKINLSVSVAEGEGWANLAKGPGRVSKTARIGDRGTTLVSGHRTMYAAPFHNLDRVEIADQLYLYTKKALFTYTVVGIKRVNPDDWSEIKPNTEPRLVLSTCDPVFSAKHRLLIIATLTGAKRIKSTD